jgi:hypothetical protein
MSKNRSGTNHYNFNPIRDEVTSNSKLRRKKKIRWIIKNMKDDPNYNNFLINPGDYNVDHIFPICAFSKILSEKIHTEQIVRKIANTRDNLQLLLHSENMKKFDKYNKEKFLKWFKSKIIDEIKLLK